MHTSQVLLGVLGLGLVAGVSHAAVVADFTFGGTGGSLTSSVGGYVATLNGAATLGSGGVALTGGYISTNMPMSLLSGKSFTMEVLATNTNPGAGYQQLIGDNNDYNSFWGQYGGQTQLYHLPGDGLAAFGSGVQGDFVNDGQIHRYVIRIRDASCAG